MLTSAFNLGYCSLLGLICIWMTNCQKKKSQLRAELLFFIFQIKWAHAYLDINRAQTQQSGCYLGSWLHQRDTQRKRIYFHLQTKMAHLLRGVLVKKSSHPCLLCSLLPSHINPFSAQVRNWELTSFKTWKEKVSLHLFCVIWPSLCQFFIKKTLDAVESQSQML